jgi:hypothetical protein
VVAAITPDAAAAYGGGGGIFKHYLMFYSPHFRYFVGY